MEDSPAVNQYIRENFTYIGNRAGDNDPVYRDNHGNYHVDEDVAEPGATSGRRGGHWDSCWGCPEPPLAG